MLCMGVWRCARVKSVLACVEDHSVQIGCQTFEAETQLEFT
jgi:hypothetical protein